MRLKIIVMVSLLLLLSGCINTVQPLQKGRIYGKNAVYSIEVEHISDQSGIRYTDTIYVSREEYDKYTVGGVYERADTNSP
jgi:hypothetical protein